MADAPHPIELDEVWLQAWIAYGMAELAYYLLKQARFQQWLERHDRKGEA